MAEQHEILSISEWYLDAQQKISRLNKASEAYGLTYDQFLVLEQIIELGNNRPGQIAKKFNTSPPVASRKLNALQNKHYIMKAHNVDDDQRTVQLEVTREGREKYSCLTGCVISDWLII
ncbi:MarR family transcriptional regulator [Latilactobacillus sakei]